MNIKSAVRDAHEKLSKYNVAFLEYTKENPAYLKRSHFNELVQWEHPGTHVKLQSWPIFIGQSTRNAFEEASVKVFELIKGIPRRLFSNNPGRISHYYNLPKEYVKQCLAGISDEHMNTLLARGDYVFSPSGLKCIEYNVTSSLGGMQLPFWEAMYLQNPLISGFIDRHQLKITNKNLISLLMEHLIDINLERFPGEHEINIAFVIQDQKALEFVLSQGEGQYINQIYTSGLQRENRNDMNRLKGEVIFCNFDQLDIRGEYIYYLNKRVHTILDNYVTDIPLEILILAKMGIVLIYNGPISVIMSSKLSLSVLSEHEDSDLFTPAERNTIKKYIPWTRKVIRGSTIYGAERINLEDFMLSNREKLVLKPAVGYGGESVYIGHHTPERQWKELTLEAFRQEQWVVQERIESRPFLFQWGESGCAEHDAVWGIFVFGARYGGIWLRVLPHSHSSGVINAFQGSKVSIVFEVDE